MADNFLNAISNPTFLSNIASNVNSLNLTEHLNRLSGIANSFVSNFQGQVNILSTKLDGNLKQLDKIETCLVVMAVSTTLIAAVLTYNCLNKCIKNYMKKPSSNIKNASIDEQHLLSNEGVIA